MFYKNLQYSVLSGRLVRGPGPARLSPGASSPTVFQLLWLQFQVRRLGRKVGPGSGCGGLWQALAPWLWFATGLAAVPLPIAPVAGSGGIVVAGHPEAAAVGAALLAAGGNAIDAAVGVSLALGVAEPYGSGLGGKLMLLFHEAGVRHTHVVDGMDQAGLSLDANAFRRLPIIARFNDWTAVAVPGLPFALYDAHARWGRLAWVEVVRPAAVLAEMGPVVLPQNRVLFAEREDRLLGSTALSLLYMPRGQLPEVGMRLPQPELAASLNVFAREGIAAFRDGVLAQAVITASHEGGGHLTMEDFLRYEVRFPSPLRVTFGAQTLVGSPPPTTGATLAFAMLKVLEGASLAPPLRTVDNLDLVGRAWRLTLPMVRDEVSDREGGLDSWYRLLSAPSLGQLRRQLYETDTGSWPATSVRTGANDATTHFVVADADGNVVSATQSLSLHFGAGVLAAGIILNNSMSNFALDDPGHPNYIAPGRRPRSTITPTLVLRDDRPTLALGAPGGQRIPTAMVQVLLDHLVLGRPLNEAIGDTRLHWFRSGDGSVPDTLESESSLPLDVELGLRSRGWKVDRREDPGTGRHFGGVNAIYLGPDGVWEGVADPRRSNAVAAP